MPPKQPPLPPSVEDLMATICREKSQSPVDDVARRYLSHVSDEDKLDVLMTIKSSSKVVNFSGFIVHLVKKKMKNVCLSPRLPQLTPTSGGGGGGGDGVSPDCRRPSVAPVSAMSSPQGNSSPPNKRRRPLNFSDEVVSSIVEHFIGSPAAYDAIADTRMEHYNGSNINNEVMDHYNVSTINGEVMANMRMELYEGSTSATEAVTGMQTSDSLSEAFAELEFRKAFLMLNYLGREKLEYVISPQKLRSFLGLDMTSFEFQIWNEFGRSLCKEKERRKYLEWGSGNSYSYRCHVYTDGSYIFKGPFLSKTTTLLHKTIGDENVLDVKFLEDEAESYKPGSDSVMSCPVFNKVAEEGIYVGKRRYQFFVFKDGGKAETKRSPTSSPVKCYFVNLEAFTSFFGSNYQPFQEKSVQDARSIFMHIHQASSMANYMARFSLIMSKTITLKVQLNDVTVQEIEDVPCLDADGEPVYDKAGKLQIHTDGTGFISEDLALMCPLNCFKGFVVDDRKIKRFNDEGPHIEEHSELTRSKSHHSEPPLLIQFRMFHKGQAIKGTVLLNRNLPPKTIQIRQSMIKVRTDEDLLAHAPSLSRFEIVGTSNKPKNSRLSKNLIALLHYGGVPREYFLERLSEALEDAKAILSKKRAALRVASNRDVDEDITVSRMISAGIPLDEPYVQHRLSVIVKEEWKSLKAGKIPINNSYYVMGTADPTGTLESGEVCVILEHGQISGRILVYRNPGVHPGDVHIVNARYVKALEDIVGNAKYGIFFPSKGPRSMADEIAGGDYDGDMYWVSRDPELLKYFTQNLPWTCCSSSPNPPSEKLPSGVELERKLFRLYVLTRFRPSHAMGMAADCWLTYMDRLLTLGDDCSGEKSCLMQKVIKLVDIYYDALDAPKKGKQVVFPTYLKPNHYPHHMERGEYNTYHSDSILGQIYDEVIKYNLDPIKVWKLPYFEAQIKYIPEARLEAAREVYNEYRRDMTAALNAGHESKTESATAVYRIYKRKLYGTCPDDEVDELDKSKKPWSETREEALAVYNASYEHATQTDDPQKCNFAWKVAGSALFKIFLEQQDEKPILFSPSVLREMFS